VAASVLNASFSFLAAGQLTSSGPQTLIAEDTTTNTMFTFQATPTAASNGFGFPNGFTVHTGIALTDGAGPVTVVDLNGDGNQDLIVAGQTSHTAEVFLGSATGIASNALPNTRFSGESGIHSLLVKDVNGDGRPDLIAEGAKGRMDIFPGNGDGTFQTTSAAGSGTLDGTTGNGGQLINIASRKTDGDLYVVTATPVGISVLLQNSTATWGLDGIYNVGPGRASYAVADLNGDGYLDLAVDSPEGIAIIYGRADGAFTTANGFARAFAAGQPAMSGAVGVFTASGNVDAVVSTAATQAQLLQGGGNGMFTYLGLPGAPTPTTTQTGIAGLTGTVQVGDFNGDGKLDLAITADGPNSIIPLLPSGMLPQDGIVIQPGSGDGTFLAPVYPPVNHVSTCPQALDPLYGKSAVADFNGDGIADLANRDFNEERISFGTTIHYAPVVQQYSTDPNCNLHAHDLIVAGDVNNDGAPDLLVQTDGHLVEELNQGGGTFTFDPTRDLSVDGALTTPGQLTAPAISSTFGGTVATSAGGLGFPAFIGSMVIADLDRDSNNDLIVVYANLSANRAAPTSSAPNRIYIWFGSGGGKFLTSAKHPVNPVVLTPSRNFYQVAVADLNGDGIPDLILSDGYILSVQLGKGDGSFGAETHYLAGQGLNTISVADVNHDGTLDLVVANGGTVWSNPVANLEQPPAAQDVNTGGITVLLNRSAAPLPTISGTVTASPEPTTYGGAFSLTAAITPSLTSNNPPTGSFTFSVNGVAVGSAAISGLSASVSVPSSVYSTLAPGTYPLTAVYSGDSNYATTTFNGSHTVNLIPTTTSLILCVDPPGSNFPCANPIINTPLVSPITLYYGQSVDGVAIESSTSLTGTITFYSGTAVFCVLSANLSQGSQTCPPNSGIFPAGTTTVTAAYSGDAVNAPSTSNGIVVTVLSDITTATVTSSLNPATVGQSVTFTADVQGNYAVGAGQVIFLDGTTTLGMATLDPTGHAAFTSSTLAVGTHPIRVAFPGSVDFNSVTSATLNQVILPVSIQSSIALASSVDPSTFGQTVTFTATVTAPGATPTGTVTFLDGTATIGTGTLNSTGVATLAISTLAVGSHPITASYAGVTTATQIILAGTSAVLTQVVNPPPGTPGFTLTVSPSPLTIGVGDTAILLVSVKALYGFSQPVALTCSGLPRESTCVFVQPTIPGGGGSTTLQLSVTAPHNCGSNTPYFVSSASQPPTAGTLAAVALFGGGFMLAGSRRRRKLLARTLFVLALSTGGLTLGGAGLSGCGNCTDLGTKPGLYNFTVVGTAQGGPSNEVEMQTIPMTVTIP
jgi:hypothetical protein